MTELFQRAIDLIKELLSDKQDEIAARLLADLQDDLEWETRFKATTDEQWDRMAEMVRREIATDGTIPLDEIFPS